MPRGRGPQQGQGGGQQQKPPHLTLDPTPLMKVGVHWETTLIASVGQGQTPWTGRQVEFYLNGGSEGTCLTDNNGRATKLITGLVAGSYTLEAVVVGTTIGNKVKVTAADEPKKPAPKPASLIVQCPGGNGKYTLTCRVLDESEKPCQGVIVELNNRTLGRLTNLPPTDAQGRTQQKFVFLPGTETNLTFSIPGIEPVWKVLY